MRNLLLFAIILNVYCVAFAREKSYSGNVTFSGKFITVPQHETWVFSPGTKVKFEPDARLIVYGGIKVLGEAKRVTFTALKRSWGGIDFIGAHPVYPAKLLRPSFSGNHGIRNIINGLTIEKVDRRDNAAVTVLRDRVLFDKTSIIPLGKTSSLSVDQSEVYFSNSRLSCSNSDYILQSNKSVLGMVKVDYLKDGNNCKTVLSTDSSLVSLDQCQFDTTMGGIDSRDSRLYLQNANLMTTTFGVSAQDTSVNLLNFKGKSYEGSLLRLVGNTVATVTGGELSMVSDKPKGCILQLSSGATIYLDDPMIPDSCAGVVHYFDSKKLRSSDTEAKNILKDYIRKQKILPYTSGSEWEHYSLLMNHLLANPKLVSQIPAETRKSLKLNSLKSSASISNVKFCTYLNSEKKLTESFILRKANDFLPLRIELMEIPETEEDCPEEDIVWRHYKYNGDLAAYVVEIRNDLNDDYTSIINRNLQSTQFKQ